MEDGALAERHLQRRKKLAPAARNYRGFEVGLPWRWLEVGATRRIPYVKQTHRLAQSGETACMEEEYPKLVEMKSEVSNVGLFISIFHVMMLA